MPHFNEITEHDLRAMAREATSLFLDSKSGGSLTPTEAVIKVASASAEPLTSEHVQRVCEMTYHDIYERSFRASPGPDRLVSFDPPDAQKVASAVRARQVESFSAKLASATRDRSNAMDKTASALVTRAPPPARNAWTSAVHQAPADTATMKKEARHLLRSTREELREAARALEIDVGSSRGAEKIAFLELVDDVVRVARQGAGPVAIVSACVEFAKSAGADDAVLETVATDLLRALPQRGVTLDGAEKVADAFLGVTLNERHPLRAQAIKVAELRGFRVHGEIALQDIRHQLHRVERELQDVLYQ